MRYKKFWVVDNGEEPCLAFNEKEEALTIRTYPDKYHVIEYQALLDEAEAHKNTAAVLQSEIEKLQKQNEKLKDALDYIAHECLNSETHCPTREEMQIKARQTLKEIENDPAS